MSTEKALTRMRHPPCSTNYKFTGYERDSETGLDYAFARYYNQRMTRFQSGDPLAGDASDPQSLNRYAYARSNPVNLVDRFGLCYQDSDGVMHDEAGAPCVSNGGTGITVIGDPVNFDPTWSDPWGDPSQACANDPLYGCYGDIGSGGCWTCGGLGFFQGQLDPPIPPKPQTPGRTTAVNQCAAQNAASLASIFHANQNNFWVSALLGNDASTLSNLVFGPNRAAAAGSFAVSNPTKYSLINAGAYAAGQIPTGG
jgi:RHS repeat-associated protein